MIDVPVGYKQTDVGIIPEDWEVKKLCSVLSTKPKYGINAAAVPLVGDLPTYIRITDISELGYFSPSERVGVYNENSGEYYLKNGDLVFARTGASVGKSYLYNPNDGLLVYAGFLIKITTDEKLLNSKYLAQYVKTNTYWTWVKSTSMRSGQPGINGNEYGQLLIPLPPTLTEQTAIATALSDVDALLNQLDKLIAKKRDIKQATMQQLLTGKKRLAGFSGEWEVKKLGDVADDSHKWSFIGGPFGSNLKSSDYVQDGIRIIQLQNIGDGLFLDDSKIFTSTEKANELISCNIYPDDIIMSKMGDPVARACIIPKIHERYLMCSDGIRLAVNKKKYDTYFIFYSINFPLFRNLAENASTGSTRKRIGLSELKNVELICPPTLEEQTAIATLLTDMDTEITQLQQRRHKTHALKQGMMQQLLTGKIRLI